LQLQQAAFCCSYNKNANEGCNSCAPPPAPVYRRRSPPEIPQLSIVMGDGSGGDAGQLTRSPGSSSASLPYVVTFDSALALAQLLLL